MKGFERKRGEFFFSPSMDFSRRTTAASDVFFSLSLALGPRPAAFSQARRPARSPLSPEWRQGGRCATGEAHRNERSGGVAFFLLLFFESCAIGPVCRVRQTFFSSTPSLKTSYLSPPLFQTQTKKRLHIAWQPLVVNEYFLGLEGDIHPDVSRLIRGLCTVAGLGLSARLAVPGNPVMALGSYLNRHAAALPLPLGDGGGGALPVAALPFVPYGPSHPGFAFPELPPAASAAGGAHCGFEALCGARLCTFQGVRHLAWSVPLLPATYLLPSGFVHAMLFFGPAVFAPGSKIVVRRILSIGAFAIGPLFSMVFSATNATRDGPAGGGSASGGAGGGAGGGGDGGKMAALFPQALGFPAGNGYANTWPAWWCFMSAAQALLILVGDVLARDNKGLTEREKNALAAAKAAARAAAAAAAAAGGKGGAAFPSSSLLSSRSRRPPMNLTASASVEHEYNVAVPAPAAAARGGSTRRRAAAK